MVAKNALKRILHQTLTASQEKVMNQFSERYKTLTNSDLLRVIETPVDYQQEAIEAARIEINQRNLSVEELTEAKRELEIQRKEKQEQNAKKIEVQKKMKTLGNSIFETLNPIQKDTPTPEKTIRLITILFGFMTFYKYYKEFGLIKFIFTDSSGGWDSSMFEYFIPLIVLPIAVVLFWKRKKVGWILMTAYLTYSAISAFGLIIMTWNMAPLGIPALDNLFPQTSPITQILTTLFFGGFVWVLIKSEVRAHFNINRQSAIVTIVTVMIITIMFIAPYLMI